MRKWFSGLNFALLAIFLLAVWKDFDTEWRRYQNAYYDRTAAELGIELAKATDPERQARLKSEIRGWKWRLADVKQIIVKDLGRVDRCVTCHVGMDEFTNPTLANNFTEHPFKAHPDVSKLVKTHPFQKFGCTACHGGQGLATTVEAAHGGVRVHVGGESLLAEDHLLRPPFLQASCAKCHGDFETLPGAEVAAKGKRLFEKNGCIGCHAVNGVGGIISVDLGDIADKPAERISAHDYHEAKMEELDKDYHTVSAQHWILAHLKRDPAEFIKNDPLKKFNKEPIAPSGMPPFYLDFKDGEAEAITTYLLSMTHEEKIPRQFYVYAPPNPEPKFKSEAEHGKSVFQKYGCAACHGIEAKGGRRNFNALGPGQDKSQPWSVEQMSMGREPDLTDTVGLMSRDELKNKIKFGVAASAIAKFNAEGPTPPGFMPPWKDKIKGEELEALVTYLHSIAKKEKPGEEW